LDKWFYNCLIDVSVEKEVILEVRETLIELAGAAVLRLPGMK
jgi:hypothetical protein